jgi:protein involved in polysaccharide export with SLBB domain
MKRLVVLALLLAGLAVIVNGQQDQSAPTVSVLGEVRNPGVYALRGADLTLRQAIALASGLTAYADASMVEITQSSSDRVIADLKAILRGSAPDVRVKVGDVVRVPLFRGR